MPLFQLFIEYAQLTFVMKYILTVSQFNSFVFATNHFKEGLPKRWFYIAQYVLNRTVSACNTEPLVCISLSEHDNNLVPFNPDNKNSCKDLYKLLCKKYGKYVLCDSNFVDVFHSTRGKQKDGLKSNCSHCPNQPMSVLQRVINYN